MTANFKETKLTLMEKGQAVSIHIDTYPDRELAGRIDSFQRGSGQRFSLLPPENATGNYVKVVQRVPVKILFDEPPPADMVLGPRHVRRPHGQGAMSQPNPDLPLSVAGKANPWLVACILSIATFMEVLDTSIANVALRYIAGDLAAGPSQSVWVLTSYLVANAIILPISGWLSNVIGRKRFYMACVALFTVSSALCALAPSLSWLIVFRIFQGMGGGGLAPSEQSMLADSFPPEKRGLAFSIYGVAVVFSPAIGPALGGWLTDNYSWHWIFIINIPFGLISLVLSYFVLVHPARRGEAAQEALRQGPQGRLRRLRAGGALPGHPAGRPRTRARRTTGSARPSSPTCAVISAVSLAVFIPWELTREDPIVDLRLLGNRGFAASCVVMFATGFILYSTTQQIPQLTQDTLGYDATLAGLLISPGGFAILCLMPLVGFLLGKVQPRWLIAWGLLIEAASCYHLSNLTYQVSFDHLMWARIYQAAGIAFLFTPITTVAYVGIPEGKNNEASALINLMKNLGGSVGISAAQAAITEWSQWHQSRLVEHLTPYDDAYRRVLPQLAAATDAGPERLRGYQALYQMAQRQASIPELRGHLLRPGHHGAGHGAAGVFAEERQAG